MSRIGAMIRPQYGTPAPVETGPLPARQRPGSSVGPMPGRPLPYQQGTGRAIVGNGQVSLPNPIAGAQPPLAFPQQGGNPLRTGMGILQKRPAGATGPAGSTPDPSAQINAIANGGSIPGMAYVDQNGVVQHVGATAPGAYGTPGGTPPPPSQAGGGATAPSGNGGFAPPAAGSPGSTTPPTFDANAYIAQLLGGGNNGAAGAGGSVTGQGVGGAPAGYPGYGIPANGATSSAGGTNNNALAALLQQYMDQANTANEGRYTDLLNLSSQERDERLGGLNDQYNQIFGQIGSGVDAQMAREKRTADSELGASQQSAVSRGLTNTTIADSMRRGVADDSALRQQEIQDGATRQELAAHADYATRLDSILGSLFQNRTGFIQNRTDQGPDINSLLPLLMAAGGGTGGTTGGGTGTGTGGTGAGGTGSGLYSGPTQGVGSGATGGTGGTTSGSNYDPSDPFGVNALNHPTTSNGTSGGGISAGVAGGYNPQTNFPFPLGVPGGFVTPMGAQEMLKQLQQQKNGGAGGGGGSGATTGGTIGGANTGGAGNPSGTGGFSGHTPAELLNAIMGQHSGGTGNTGIGGDFGAGTIAGLSQAQLAQLMSSIYGYAGTGGDFGAGTIDGLTPDQLAQMGNIYGGAGTGIFDPFPNGNVDSVQDPTTHNGVPIERANNAGGTGMFAADGSGEGGAFANPTQSNAGQDAPQWIDPGDGSAPGWYRIDPTLGRYVKVG